MGLGGLHGAAFASLLPPLLPPFSAKVVEEDGFALAYLVEAFVDGDAGLVVVAASDGLHREAGGAKDAVVGVEGRKAGVRDQGHHHAEHMRGVVGGRGRRRVWERVVVFVHNWRGRGDGRRGELVEGVVAAWRGVRVVG